MSYPVFYSLCMHSHGVEVSYRVFVETDVLISKFRELNVVQYKGSRKHQNSGLFWAAAVF